MRRRFLLAALGSGLSLGLWSRWEGRAGAKPATLALPRRAGHKARNVILIVTDDQRYDALGFVRGQRFLETPRLDALASSGVHFRNAFVSTALCSPSRATILTSLYAHQHRVVDNNHPVDPQLVFFPQYLRRAGYRTALIGKWHMGGLDDAPQRGFDHWVSFKGQGSYVPTSDGLNVNGTQVPQRGYITDELTEYAIDWLSQQKANKPFFLLLGHKAVHSKLVPAPRHAGKFDREQVRLPPSATKQASQGTRPLWAQNQRNSTHGVDFPYHTKTDISEYLKRYAETLLSVDESVGAIVDHLKGRGMLDSTVLIFMSDNGFAFGEHGLIDKRTAYEESMRIPLLMHCPELLSGGQSVEALAANLDIAPTILELAGLTPPTHMQGKSLLPLARGEGRSIREHLLYEYYWERNYPQTPTTFALRAQDYKYIRYHGVWDVDELFDLRADPSEENNLIYSPGHAAIATQMNTRLFEVLQETGGMQIPLREDSGDVWNLRTPAGAAAATFPEQFFKK